MVMAMVGGGDLWVVVAVTLAVTVVVVVSVMAAYVVGDIKKFYKILYTPE